jgi:uncharacterized Ntn-hydrolase superfamily protein
LIRPCHTYSITALDPETGEMGAAVQSHWFSVGSAVPWAEPGAGVVVTGSFANLSFGLRGLTLLRRGRAAGEVLQALLAEDPGRELRQAAVLDGRGGAAAHTGTRCVPEAGHRVGRSGAGAYSVQANMMASASVWPAMAEAYERALGPLAERMLTALRAAQEEGGDLRGQQSAALVVVRTAATDRPWEDRLVELRPRSAEARFWQGLTLAGAGRQAEGVARLRRLFLRRPAWRILARRLRAIGLLPLDAGAAEKLGL